MNRWVVCTSWTTDASLSGYDYDEVLSTHAAREEAQAECDRVYRDHLGTVDEENRVWCIGVAIAREPEPGYSPSPSYADEDSAYWAESVPEEVLAWE